jgi:hypothetical protein
MMFQLLLLFTVATEGVRLRLHKKMQTDPDQACEHWLNSTNGQNFLQCEDGNPGLPVPTGSCAMTQADLDAYCSDSCFETLMDGYNFFLRSGVCLSKYEDKYKPCGVDTDCPTQNGTARICHEGFCYQSCSTDSDCNSCLAETCDVLGLMKGCRSSDISYEGSSKTMQNAFRGYVYSLEAGCSKREDGTYCALMDLTNQTCETLSSQWGCCANTLLPSTKFCEWTTFTDPNFNQLLNCDFTQAPCNGLPLASLFCNGSSNIDDNDDDKDKDKDKDKGIGGHIGNIGGNIDGSIDNVTGHIGDHNGNLDHIGGHLGDDWKNVGKDINRNSTGNGASGQAVSWATTIALVLLAAHIV